MKNRLRFLLPLLCVALAGTALAAKPKPEHAGSHTPPVAQKSVTRGGVVVEGKRIDYTATAGTIILTNKQGQPTGSMFYVAYTKRGANLAKRPVTFFYNGGPGSSSVWIHMAAFGPRRVQLPDHVQAPAAPYRLVNNDYSLLDATDEVFVDAMSTGYSRIIGKAEGGVGTKKDFYGYDPDVRSFAQFITRYLSQNNRWNSPKYLYGESYGTVRSELLANYLEQEDDIDLNGVVLQSAYTGNNVIFGSDIGYETNLPTFAAVAWYHYKIPNQPARLRPFLQQVEQFADNQYAVALTAGNTLSPARFAAIAEKLHDYTGLSTAYIEKSNLRVSNGAFRHQLLGARDETVGDLDGRYVGPSMNPMSPRAEYDPTESAVMSAIMSAFNGYVHNTLKFGRDRRYRPMTNVFPWSRKHVNLLTGQRMFSFNAGVDLAQAIKYDPDLKVEVDAGYFDLNLPFGGMVYSVNHLSLPKSLQGNIQFKFYHSGHMIYLHVPALKQLHDNTAAFIAATDHSVQGR
ncbi:MAG TPA: peptidase S10 [Rhodanobacteraceae bacterium]